MVGTCSTIKCVNMPEGVKTGYQLLMRLRMRRKNIHMSRSFGTKKMIIRRNKYITKEEYFEKKMHYVRSVRFYKRNLTIVSKPNGELREMSMKIKDKINICFCSLNLNFMVFIKWFYLVFAFPFCVIMCFI